MTTELQAIGYKLSNGKYGALPRRLRRIAERVEGDDLRALLIVATEYLENANFMLRPFFRTGERELFEAMGIPIRPDHIAMLCVVSDGGIDRKPLTEDQFYEVQDYAIGSFMGGGPVYWGIKRPAFNHVTLSRCL